MNETKWWRQREKLHAGRAESLELFGGGQSTDLQPNLTMVMALPESGLFSGLCVLIVNTHLEWYGWVVDLILNLMLEDWAVAWFSPLDCAECSACIWHRARAGCGSCLHTAPPCGYGQIPNPYQPLQPCGMGLCEGNPLLHLLPAGGAGAHGSIHLLVPSCYASEFIWVDFRDILMGFSDRRCWTFHSLY